MKLVFKSLLSSVPQGVVNAFWFSVISITAHLVFVATGRETHTWGWVIALNHGLMQAVYEITVWVNREVMHFVLNEADPFTIIFPGRGYLIIVDGCSGLKQLYQALVLFLFYPGRPVHKVWFIPVVMGVMFIANALRMIFLSATVVWYPGQWDLVHNWVLRPLIYVVLFLLWLVWVRWYQQKSPRHSAARMMKNQPERKITDVDNTF